MTVRHISILLVIFSLGYMQCELLYAQDALFPIVSPSIQKTRDDDRRQILEAELQAERQVLVNAQAALATGFTRERATNVHRHVENVTALERELELVAAAQSAPRGAFRLVVKNQRQLAAAPRNLNGAAAFWNPYNRAPDPDRDASIDLSTTSRRDLP